MQKNISNSKSIDSILKNIEKSMKNIGSPIIEKAPTLKDFNKVPVISFGYPEVDEASGCGGIPRGKMVEIYGPESGGKSFLSLKLIATAQSEGIRCLLVDAENSYDPIWASSHGVETDDLYIIRSPLSAEATLDYVDEICNSGAFGLVVVDSTAALIPAKELEGSIGDQDYALLARALSKGCRKIVSSCIKTNTTCVFLNQVREKMGVMFGNPETTPGGRALKFYSHQRIKVTPGKKVTVKENDKDVVIARQSWVQFVKNKSARPFGECIIEIIFDQAARHPLVKLCKQAKEQKIISLREGTFRINKSILKNQTKNLDTSQKTLVELADYILKNNFVEIILKTYLNTYEDENGSLDGVDPDILNIRDNLHSIVSPMDDSQVVDNYDLSIENLDDEISEDDVNL